jgi:hypothetical protein
MLTEEQERVCTEASPVGRRKSRGSILSFGGSQVTQHDDDEAAPP